MKIAALMDLAASASDKSEAHLERIYEWRVSAYSSASKGAAGAGLATALSTLVPVLAQDPTAELSWVGIIVAWSAAGVLLTAGVILHAIGRRLESEYLAAQGLLAELRDISAFLRLYKGRT